MKHLLASTMLLISLSAHAATERQAVHDSAERATPLMPGMAAPAFEVRDTAGQAVTFDPDALSNPLVLTFYRGGWCPYCNLHLAELRHVESRLRDMGFEVWFISMDQPEQLASGMADTEFDYRLLSDSGAGATRAFGIAFRVDDETYLRYRNFGVDLEAASGQTHHILPVPSTFIIGRDGLIHFQYSNPNYTVRLHPDVLLAAARAYLDDADGRLLRQREAQKSE